jgi:hypothetical protein
MSDMITQEKIEELLTTKADGYLYHRESKDLEFKAQFNFAESSEYYRDFAGFANNSGGYIIFGVSNSPRKINGLNDRALTQFEEIDPATISGNLLDIFSSNIQWEQCTHQIGELQVGIFYIFKSEYKPVISKINYGNHQHINAGEIYYRYAGRTQKIQFAELNHIIENRIQENTNQLLSLIKKVSVIGPANAAILDTEKGIIQKDENQVLVIDEDLIPKIKFIREGHFVEKEGSTTLKLIGDVQPINTVEVTKTIQKRLIDQYPYSCAQLCEEIKKLLPEVKQNAIYQAIKDDGIKNNMQYSAYNFRTKQHEIDYKQTGIIPAATTSLYNAAALEFLVKVLE